MVMEAQLGSRKMDYQTHLTNERLLAGMNSNMARQFVASTESPLAIVQRATVGSFLNRCLRRSVWVFARFNWFQIERMATGLFENLQSFAGGRAIGREHRCITLVLFLIASHLGDQQRTLALVSNFLDSFNFTL